MADRLPAGVPAEPPSCAERLDVGGGDRGRYLVSRTCVHRRPIPEPLPAGIHKILDQEGLREMLLQQFTREQARHMLAPVSRQLAASVRDERVQWKALTEFKFESDDSPDMETVHDLFQQAYPFYRRVALDPYAEWLLNALFRANIAFEKKWQIIFECIPNEGYAPITPDDWGLYSFTPEEVTENYKRWLANPNRRWDVFKMKTLSDKIERKCLERISPSCWQSWKDPPGWCRLVHVTFIIWEEKLGFKLDVNRIHKWSILAKIDEDAFRKVSNKIGRKIRQKMFKNWNQFGFALLKECHNQYYPPEDEMDDEIDTDVRGDFDRDRGPDFDDPEFENPFSDFYRPQLENGGCAGTEVRPDKPSEPGPEDQLRVFMKGLQPKLTVEQLDGYMETLNNSMLDLDTLKHTISDSGEKGKEYVINSLLRAGIQPERMALRLANAISDLVLKEKNER